MNRVRAAAIAAVAVLGYVIAVDESNIVSQIARKAIDIIKTALGI